MLSVTGCGLEAVGDRTKFRHHACVGQRAREPGVEVGELEEQGGHDDDHEENLDVEVEQDHHVLHL